MEHGGPPEKWAATQCLALSGVITDKVIVELVNHLHADNAVRTEKAGTLLAKLSQQSVSFSNMILNNVGEVTCTRKINCMTKVLGKIILESLSKTLRWRAERECNCF